MPCSKSIAAVTAFAASIATPAFAIDSTRSPQQLEARCAALSNMSIAAKAIGLPTHGATISFAELASLASPATDAPARYCKVLGAVAPVDQGAYPVNFEINMPITWNGRAVQYGGGGYNGVLITGLDPLRDQPPDLPPPVGRGFMTFGTDSGHRSKDLPEIMAFALNNEALINFAYASYNKTRDVALAVSTAFYGRKPDHL